ncbi:hypothetical protein HXA31_20490 [Salipaludibacillus agaradhaerens]|uniref:IrrE N-terminal-like domain-containing protein n=1 Tax=Salipaludibacillus agaradhaerens TaxID=76935 RepID=A0A9Q4B2M7_SALAG|nr:ImmA/IrrE family metallo-endopeptidase [Salipaludibacillus agaradhaerens]MCR6096867.1 hypothetical protein [Salipaludibacillus agaradhaerens]MCR6116711.1 hypothetical protein [Salipaludibacillus agaradhaerens]
MSIPSTVKVGGVTYDIEFKEYIEINGDRNYSGCCDYQNTTIEICDDLSDERKREVYAHELMHAIFYESGYQEQDEDMINRLGLVFNQVLKDNYRKRKITLDDVIGTGEKEQIIPKGTRVFSEKEQKEILNKL